MIEEVVKCIVALDDISADDATQLVTLLSVLIERSPHLFESDGDEDEMEEDNKEVRFVYYGKISEIAKVCPV